MSFFDEVEEPRPAPRTTERRRRPSGSGRRPPSRQTIQLRRGVFAVVVLIVIVLIVIGIHSCDVSATKSALMNYDDNVALINQQSDQTGSTFFTRLSAGNTSNPTGLQQQLDDSRASADDQLSRAQKMSVPSQVQNAQRNFLLVLQMRRDGITNIAQDIQQALTPATSTSAIDSIAAEMARFYASDVLYKDYTLPSILGALHAAGVTGSVQLSSSQFLPTLQWLTPAYVASALQVTMPTSHGKLTPGTHGHELNSVSVAGTTLQTGATNTIPARPAPTFTLNFENSGQNVETNVVCKVTVRGTSDSGRTIVSQTTPGERLTCQVTLNSVPPTGTQTVVATIEPVPGEKNVANNTLTFPVTFQ